MPRYKYNCKACGNTVSVFHTLEEIYTDCEKCETTGSMEKVLSNVHIFKVGTKNSNQGTKVGEITKKYIEENRELLKKEKEDLRNKTHEPT